MSPENPGRGELAQPVADHILSDENFDVRLSVVDEERVPNKLGDNCARPRPRLDRLFFPRLVEFLNLREDVGIDERTFLK